MTQTRSSAESVKNTKTNNTKKDRSRLRLPKAHELFDLNAFLMTLRSLWPLFMLFAIVMFFSMPILTWLGTDGREYTNRTIEQLYRSSIHSVTVAQNIIAVCAGVFTALFVMRDFMRSSSAGFYCSLPTRREGILLVRTVSGIAVYLAALALNALLMLGVSVMTGAGAYVGMMVRPLMTALVIFIFLYTLTMLCGTLCGMTVTQLILTALVLVLPPLIWSLTVSWCGEHIINLWTGLYLNESVFGRLIGMRLLYVVFENDALELFEYFALLGASIVFVILAVILFRMRDNEKAGNAAVFGLVGPIVKYASMTAAAIVGGFIFYEMIYSGHSIFRWMFGWMAAALLTFMLVNAVLHRSAKAVMKGIKWTPLFAVPYLVINLCIIYDVADLGSMIPNPSLVSSVTLEVDGMSYKFRDRENIEAVIELVLASERDNDDGVSYESYLNKSGKTRDMNVTYTSDHRSMNIAYNMKFGLPLAKYYYLEINDQTNAAIKTLRSSEEFAEQYGAVFDGQEYAFYANLGITMSGNNSFSNTQYVYQTGTEGDIRLECVTDAVDENYFDRLQLGRVYLYDTKANKSGATVIMPVYYGDALAVSLEDTCTRLNEYADDRFGEKVTEPSVSVVEQRPIAAANEPTANAYREIESYCGGFLTEDNIDEYIDLLIDKITVIDTESGASKEYRDTEDIKQIMLGAMTVPESSSSFFAVGDFDYWVEYTYNNINSSRTGYLVTFFREGSVPELVVADFE